MVRCIVCNHEMSSPVQPCSRCGFLQPAVVGDLDGAQNFINARAAKYRQELLSRYDFGVTVYYWKDNNGTVVLDREERLSFGSADALLGNPVWLEQQFARTGDETVLELELSVAAPPDGLRRLPVSIPLPSGRHLHQVGARIDEDLSLRLMLRNPEGQTESTPLWFLGE